MTAKERATREWSSIRYITGQSYFLDVYKRLGRKERIGTTNYMKTQKQNKHKLSIDYLQNWRVKCGIC